MAGLLRHIEAVTNVTLSRGRRARGRLEFRLGEDAVGWVTPEGADAIVATGLPSRREADAIALPLASGLPALIEALAGVLAFPLRGEAFDVRAQPGGAVLATMDRGALPWFGVAAEGVHVNGLVSRADGRTEGGLHVWIGRRSATRLMDPGKLDHMVAGGIPAGMTPQATLVKEGAEEAGLTASTMQQASPVGRLSYSMMRPEGLRRDTLHCYDLMLDEGVQPVPNDGEVTSFELWPAARVIRTLRDTDDFKFNVAVVLLDLFARHAALPDPVEGAALEAALLPLRGGKYQNPEPGATGTAPSGDIR